LASNNDWFSHKLRLSYDRKVVSIGLQGWKKRSQLENVDEYGNYDDNKEDVFWSSVSVLAWKTSNL
jgi:hypothetical protein